PSSPMPDLACAAAAARTTPLAPIRPAISISTRVIRLLTTPILGSEVPGDFSRVNPLALLRARCERPSGSCAAECSQQFPPSDGDCHTPLPCARVRKWNDTTPRACCPNSAAPGASGAHAGHRPQRSAAWPPDSGLISRDLSSAAPLHFVNLVC